MPLGLHIGRAKRTWIHAQISVGKLNNVREAIAIAGGPGRSSVATASHPTSR